MLVGGALAPVVAPFVLLSRLLGLSINLTKDDVASYIRSGLSPKDDGRWDDFEQIKIRDPELEAIRQEALSVKFPLTATDRSKLETLLAKLEEG
jgi:hypothetical protein